MKNLHSGGANLYHFHWYWSRERERERERCVPFGPFNWNSLTCARMNERLSCDA